MIVLKNFSFFLNENVIEHIPIRKNPTERGVFKNDGDYFLIRVDDNLEDSLKRDFSVWNGFFGEAIDLDADYLLGVFYDEEKAEEFSEDQKTRREKNRNLETPR